MSHVYLLIRSTGQKLQSIIAAYESLESAQLNGNAYIASCYPNIRAAEAQQLSIVQAEVGVPMAPGAITRYKTNEQRALADHPWRHAGHH